MLGFSLFYVPRHRGGPRGPLLDGLPPPLAGVQWLVIRPRLTVSLIQPQVYDETMLNGSPVPDSGGVHSHSCIPCYSGPAKWLKIV